MKRAWLLVLGVLPSLTFSADADQDARQLVQMPAEARAGLRAEMLDFQSTLNEIIDDLAQGKGPAAADVAEKMIGVSAMGRHRTSAPNARPGMFMPQDMHQIALNMHMAASEFAKVARTGDTAKALSALTAVTGACVACHRTYRTQ